MNEFAEGQEFRVILKSVPAEAAEEAAAELVLLFPIDRAPAAQIVQAVPIILLDKLSAAQAANVDSNLGCLRRLGADVAVTSEPAGSTRRLNWPVMPDIAKHAGNVFICPQCGQRLAVHAVPAHAAALAPVIAKPAPLRPRPAAVQPAVAAPPAALQPRPAAPAANAVASGQAAPKPVLTPPPAPPPKPQAKPPQAAGKWSLVEDEDEDDDDDLLELVEEAPGPKQEANEIRILDDVKLAEAAPTPPAATSAPANPAAVRKSLPGGIRVTFVAKLKPVQKGPVAEVVAKYQGVSIEEAMQAVNKPVVTVLKGATKDQADECRKELKALGISAQLHER